MEYKFSLEELDRLTRNLSPIYSNIERLRKDKSDLENYILTLERDYSDSSLNLDMRIEQRLRMGERNYADFFKKIPIPSPMCEYETEMDIEEKLIEILKSTAKEELSKTSEKLRKIKQKGITITI
jgi:hypothetical protein